MPDGSSDVPQPPTGSDELAARGRPRDPAVDDAVLAAAWRILAEGGLEALTIEGAARAAGVAKTTVYRRWPTRDHLAAAAIGERSPVLTVPDLGSLRAELEWMGDVGGELLSDPELLEIYRVLIRGMASSGPLGDLYWTRYTKPRRDEILPVIERAAARGEIPPPDDPDLCLDVIGGTFVYLVMKPEVEPFADRWRRVVPVVAAALGADRAPRRA